VLGLWRERPFPEELPQDPSRWIRRAKGTRGIQKPKLQVQLSPIRSARVHGAWRKTWSR
jgi:hypothetical protein